MVGAARVGLGLAYYVVQREGRGRERSGRKNGVFTLTSLEVLVVGRTRMVREGMLVTSTVMSHVPSSTLSPCLTAICLRDEGRWKKL